MKTSEMVETIKGNLGNRASGRIGSQDVDTAVLSALNLAIPHCVQEARPDYYNRTASISLVTGTREYDLPIVDDDANTILIKDIYAHRCYRADGTDSSLIQLNYKSFVEKIVDYALDVSGTPRYFALWGETNKLYLDYIPSEDFTLNLFVSTYPNPVTSADLNIALPVDTRWELIVEAYATQYLYLKLQQIDMHRFWNDVYIKQKASVGRMEEKKQTKNISAESPIGTITDPVLNPMCRSWNS